MKEENTNNKNHPGKMSVGISALEKKTTQTSDKSLPGWNKAFTLIELLVVVLIIGILSAIALPKYEASVEKSRIAEAKIRTAHIKRAIDLLLMERGYLSFDFETNPELVGLDDLECARNHQGCKSKNFLYQGHCSNATDPEDPGIQPYCYFNACRISSTNGVAYCAYHVKDSGNNNWAEPYGEVMDGTEFSNKALTLLLN